MGAPEAPRGRTLGEDEGPPGGDAPLSVHNRRFHHSLTGHGRWIRERSHEAYAKNYSVVFPHDEPLAGRNMRTDPLHEVPQPHTPALSWLQHSRGVLGVGRQRARGTLAAGHMRCRGGWFAPGICG